MAETSKIEWTDATWNPVTGCTLVSEGCRNCYAARLAATRLKHHPSRKGLARLAADGEAKFTGEVRLNGDWLDQPLGWKRPRRIFVCAHGDLFHEAVPDEWIDAVFAVMALAPRHTFQLLTKRPGRMRAYLAAPWIDGDVAGTLARYAAQYRVWIGLPHIDEAAAGRRAPGWPLANVWLGVSVEDQRAAGERIAVLLDTPAAIRFVSAEPLLGPVDLSRYLTQGTRHLDWVICGGESGPGARPMHPDWARSLRDQCAAAGVPFFFKQWGAWAPAPARADLPGRPQMVRARDCFVTPTGWSHRLGPDLSSPLEGLNSAPMRRRSQRAAGRVLDGVVHDGFPGAGAAP